MDSNSTKIENTTEDTTPRKVGESKMFGCSVRSIIAVTVTYTVCLMALSQIEIKEPLYSLSIAVIAYYMGQHVKSKPQL